jgi:nitrogen PTS system EIIA component
MATHGLNFPTVDLPASAVTSPDAVVKFLVGQLVQSGKLRPQDAEPVTRQVLRRESQGSTAIGRGVALPHSKSELVEEVTGVCGRCEASITWPGAADEKPIYFVCLMVTPASQPAASLRALEEVVRQLRDDTIDGSGGSPSPA